LLGTVASQLQALQQIVRREDRIVTRELPFHMEAWLTIDHKAAGRPRISAVDTAVNVDLDTGFLLV